VEAFCSYSLETTGPPPLRLLPAELCSAESVRAAAAAERVDTGGGAVGGGRTGGGGAGGRNTGGGLAGGGITGGGAAATGWWGGGESAGINAETGIDPGLRIDSGLGVDWFGSAAYRARRASADEALREQEGLVNSYTVEACNDPNCIVCAMSYLSCKVNGGVIHIHT